MSGSMRISHDFHSRQKGHGHGHHTHKKGPQQELEDRLREEVAIRKKEHQLHEEMLAQADEEQQKFEALHKQMRGKDYGYDCKGQVCCSGATHAAATHAAAHMSLRLCVLCKVVLN